MIISCVLGYFETVGLNMHAHDDTFLLWKKILRVWPHASHFDGFLEVFSGAVGFTGNLEGRIQL